MCRPTQQLAFEQSESVDVGELGGMTLSRPAGSEVMNVHTVLAAPPSSLPTPPHLSWPGPPSFPTSLGSQLSERAGGRAEGRASKATL